MFLILSAGSIYYSTHVYLNYPYNWWIQWIAGAGVVFFGISMFLMYQDYQHESEYRDLLKREKRADVLSKEAEVERVETDQASQEAEPPADIAKEDEPLPQR